MSKSILSSNQKLSEANNITMKNTISHFMNFFGRIKKQGFMKTFRHIPHWLSEHWYDVRYNIRTLELISLKPHDNDDRFIEYSPSPYSAIRSALRKLNHESLRDAVFLDFGCGAGRVPIVAASMLPLHKVIGLELVDELCTLARSNVTNARIGPQCAPIEIVHCDARKFLIPDKDIIAFFYNPFKGEILNEVLDNIKKSFSENPRNLTIIFLTPTNIEKYRKENRWPELNHSFQTYPHLCNIYGHTDPRAGSSL